MIFRNSMLSILRTKGKTALFLLLIFALTLSLCLGISLWVSIEGFLENLDNHYMTIGLIEYVGPDYPNDTVYDLSMTDALKNFDFSLITGFDDTILWDGSSRAIGYIDGFYRTDSHIPNNGSSILVVGSTIPSGDGFYNAIVYDVIYSNLARKNTKIIINAGDIELQYGRYYLVYGNVYRALSSYLYFSFDEYSNLMAKEKGIEVPYILDITTDAKTGPRYRVPDDSVLYKVADTWKVINNSVIVCATDNLMSLFPFHQQELYIREGREFTDEEYKNGSRVCIISETAAKRIGVGVGDKINLSIAVSDYPGIENSFWTENGFQYSGEFTVVGITNNTQDKDFYVFVPKSSGIPVSRYYIGYAVGQAVIKNQSAAEFYEYLEPYMTGKLNLTIYDQGYSAVAEPFGIILRIIKIVTVVCAVMEIAMLALFGFLFVYRQRETSEIMLLLGTGKKRVCAYFLYSSGLISLIATLAGAVTGYYLHERVIRFITGIAGGYTTVDRRFSDGNLSVVKSLNFDLEMDPWLFVVAGFVIFVLAMLFCLAFTILTFRNKPGQRKMSGPKRAGKTSRLRGGSIKYAMLSILRGGARSAIVPVVAAVVVFFFGQTANTSNSYHKQLSEIYKNTTITGYFTDINGKQVGNLQVEAANINSLYHSGYITDLSVSWDMKYYYLGISRFADGTEREIEPLYVPQGFAAETIRNHMQRGPSIVGTNDIRTVPEFFYSDNIIMEFIDGFDESFLAKPTGDMPDNEVCCMIPTSLMKEKGINLGDTIRVATDETVYSEKYGAEIFYEIDLKVVGCFEKQGSEDLIYVPLSMVFDTERIWGKRDMLTGAPEETFDTGYTAGPEQNGYLSRFTFKSAVFKLADTGKLSEFKDYLEKAGYSQVNKIGNIREFVVLRDQKFNNVVNNINQQIRYLNVLYPCLYVLVGIIAVIISYLMTASRRMEFAVMRGLGTTKRQTFFSFFAEQVILSAAGCVLGLIVWRLLAGTVIPMHRVLITGFLVCYFTGSAVSVSIMNGRAVSEILSDRD
ncbi:ABC transporter permease [Thermoclostridium stercorarium subsp. thermolacticum DSM 2910]|uniref:ABC transporter permease n=1 Tax=Thermoclostridium stercorarium subsp. thermolacticum DSM 2910 TaxID=1121336 RepID=A0A1B1YGL2_THEST|nr:ABC transporter permease [Thermoclostridium stercorarium]ANW99899.1 ABC transporter permease [Thermoclostridium stercorarium subsp. thermolacticum DSM 2910]